MDFRELVNALRRKDPGVSVINSQNVDVSTIAIDSRKVTPGTLFAALPGEKHDGTAFFPDAVSGGAVAVLTSRRLPTNLPQLISREPRKTLAHLCAALYGNPSEMLDMVGITGTNGKTTTTYLVQHILERVNRSCGMIGTVECKVGKDRFAASMTTPEATSIQRWLTQMLLDEQRSCVMEVSSHALVQRRTDAIDFDVAVFTNLTQDHLDYHESMEEYFLAKAQLFSGLKESATALINIDDTWGERLFPRTRARILRYGFNQRADLRASDLEMTTDGMSFDLNLHGKELTRITSRLTGRYNAYNLLAGIGSALSLGFEIAPISEAIRSFRGTPGRLERVEGPKGQPAVFVDYAHTPDALENVCKTLRDLCQGRKLVTVFGCGGDRDASKRPLMGAIAERLSDHIIVTSDNPRTENPDKIIQDILAGLRGGPIPTTQSSRLTACSVESDRSKAIELGIQAAGADGIVLIAGKGHEDYQVVGTEKRHFDDREEARACLHNRGTMTHA